ncbi:MAG: efflux RND transporter periplasmic adaptor subunit [Spirochaetaceae bacterium]|jgi:multidrug efflux pump subunit AcrA (membrane-fusion protein)|nr:efflux RND transporter periplasmic adaptor subunit [Spirochaetaceae bacterium]
MKYRNFVSTPSNRTALALAAMLLPAVLGGCRRTGRESPGESSPAEVRTVIAREQRYIEELVSFGTIAFKTKNDVTAQVEGTLGEMLVKEGDGVSSGQILGRLQNGQLEIQEEQTRISLEQAQAALSLAKTKLRDTICGIESRLLSVERHGLLIRQKEIEAEKMRIDLEKSKKLLDLGGVTPAAYGAQELACRAALNELEVMRKERTISALSLTAEDLHRAGIVPEDDPAQLHSQIIDLNTRGITAEINAAESALRNARKSLDTVTILLAALTLRTPAEGVVGARYYETGEFVRQNERVFTVMDTGEVYAVIPIQEQDLGYIAPGGPVTVEIPSLGETLAARIDEISPIADPQSGNFSIKALLGNQEARLKPGMFVRCVLPRSESLAAVVIPESAAASQTAEGAVVFSVRSGVAVRRTLPVHARKDGLLWVREGLDAGEMVIDHPSPFLRDGEGVLP